MDRDLVEGSSKTPKNLLSHAESSAGQIWTRDRLSRRSWAEHRRMVVFSTQGRMMDLSKRPGFSHAEHASPQRARVCFPINTVSHGPKTPRGSNLAGSCSIFGAGRLCQRSRELRSCEGLSMVFTDGSSASLTFDSLRNRESRSIAFVGTAS